MRIAIKAEHATRPGTRAWRYETEDNWGSDDIVVYEGTESELRCEAVRLVNAAIGAPAGTDEYLFQTAKAIAEEVGPEA